MTKTPPDAPEWVRDALAALRVKLRGRGWPRDLVTSRNRHGQISRALSRRRDKAGPVTINHELAPGTIYQTPSLALVVHSVRTFGGSRLPEAKVEFFRRVY